MHYMWNSFDFLKSYVHYHNILITYISIIVIIEFFSASHEYLKHSSISCKLSRVPREDIDAILRNVQDHPSRPVEFKSIVSLTKNRKVIHV